MGRKSILQSQTVFYIILPSIRIDYEIVDELGPWYNVRKIHGGFKNLTAPAISPSNQMLVASDSIRNKLYFFKDNELYQQIDYSKVISNAYLSGELLINAGESLNLFNLKTKVKTPIQDVKDPTDIIVYKNGIIITEPSKISLLNTLDNSYKPLLESIANPTNISIYNDKIYVADPLVGIYLMDDVFIKETGIDKIRVDTKGHIWATSDHLLKLFNQKGEYMGALKFPEPLTGLSLSNNGLYITSITSLYYLTY